MTLATLMNKVHTNEQKTLQKLGLENSITFGKVENARYQSEGDN